MAPSRRKGAAKAAAAAAAARREWKVGDLVLAKVKGFPAWPATVSEPAKWGYSADWKKVLVYFFGTQQIAFCNPADVEPFTEEKKQTLLTKRQGRSADFVRAVQEIIDSFEKSKKQDRVDLNSGDDIAIGNSGNSLESSAHFEMKDQRETSDATITGRNDPSLQTDDALDASQNGSSHDKEVELEPLANSRKRSGSLRSRKCIMLETASSLERSRSSSRLDSCPFQNFMMSMDDGNKSVRDMSIDAVRDRSVQRNKQIKKSPDGSQSDNADSSAFVNNFSIEDNGSEIITADSDSFSLNEGSTLDSGYRLEHSETAQCLEADVGSHKGLDFQINAVVIKKKRKQNRKRATSEVAETARMETEAGVDVGMHDNSQNSQNPCQSEMQNKEDGDEHLPLVKRARVRMGKQSSFEECNDNSQVEERTSKEAVINLVEEDTSFCQAGEKTSTKVRVDTLERINPFTNFSDGFPSHRESFVVRGTSYIASPVKDCTLIPENRPQLLKVKESAHSEAALPPCKRLHRALEAMSANAAEDHVSAMKTSINYSSVSSDKSSFQMVNVSRDGNGSEEQSVDSPGNIVSAFSPGSRTILEDSNKSSLDVKIFNDSESFKCQEPCQDVFPESTGHCHGKDLSGLSCGNHNACTSILAKSPVCLMPNLDTKQASAPTNDGSFDQLLLPKDEANSHDIELKEFGAGTADKGLVGPNLISKANEVAKVASQNATDGLHFSIEEAGCEDSETLISQIDNNSQANAMCEVAKDVKCDEEQKEASYVSLSDYHLSDKDGLAETSPFQADRVESPVQISPSNTVICHVSTSESTNFIQNSSSCSPNSLSHPKKNVCSSVDEEKIESMVPQRMKSIGKSNNSAEADAALSSFEVVLGSLTRTRESIGRATRIAIDCAKFGASAKVLEILAHTLESESNLHRRVDLFFLVDSIAQCSRGLKGDVGGVYPSVIQTVLPRLLSAAAPPGSFAHENRRQCLKVLRLWLERRILPESIIRHHIKELDSFGLSSAGPYARRSARTERPLDDPVRDMEGMLVDEYGSNSSFQLPGFCMPRMLKDEDDGTDSDGGFEAVTPERNIESPKYQETNPVIEKHTHILEDVDGELEMEDVAPTCEAEMNATNGIAGGNATQNSHNQFELCLPQPSVPPLPSSLPLPSSPPPLPPPPPHAVPHSCELPDPCTNSHNLQDDSRQSMRLDSMAPSINPSVSNAVPFHTSECRDQMPVQRCGSTRSFSSYPARQMNFVRHTDGPGFHHKPYPPRPPHPPPSNHFSYVQASQHVKSRRGLPPPSYSHRFHPSHNVDGGNFYNNHERMRPDPYEFNDGWRYPPTDFPGPRYPDKAKASYAPVPYDAPPREPRFHHQDWQYHARGMHHRNFMPSRPSECVIPVENRGPSMWWPR